MDIREKAKAVARSLLERGRSVLGALVKRRVRVTVAVVAALVLGLRLIVPHQLPSIVLEPAGGARAKTLVVVAHGLGGYGHSEMVALAKRLYPDADRIAPRYMPGVFANLSNVDPYELTNALEQTIHEAYETHGYDKIVLFGYSLGALILRKTLVWAYGHEADRTGAKGKRRWVGKVDRFVSLAGMSRGWSIDPIPSKMPWYRYILYLAGELVGRFTGTGQLILGMQRGAPFVADLRIQWLDLAKDSSPRKVALPKVIHLLGDRDDIVSIEDSRDIAASPGVQFVTLADTDHANIRDALDKAVPATEISPQATRRRTIERALAGETDKLPSDRVPKPSECPRDSASRDAPEFAKRVVYVMHGIRDYAEWADRIRQEVEKRPARERAGIVVVPAKYGWFPMAPFLAYYDRQKHVRWFMDTYTENRALMPCLKQFDYLGHSNGTYILASALQHYKTLKVDNVYFAGSVVPKHYPWSPLIPERVKSVTNVVATADWVVAFFPRLFEQVAEWIGSKPVTGLLDIGSAGFHGFEAAADPRDKIRNITYAQGGHGTGVDVSKEKKLDALVGFVLRQDRKTLAKAFEEAPEQDGRIAFASNLSWVVWVALAFLIGLFGAVLWFVRFSIDFTVLPRTVRLGTLPFYLFAIVLALLLFSV
jgi:predicted esterase